MAWNTALAKIGTIKTAVIYYSLPLWASIEAYVILGEQLHLPQVIGGILVIGGIVLSNLNQTKKFPAQKEKKAGNLS